MPLRERCPEAVKGKLTMDAKDAGPALPVPLRAVITMPAYMLSSASSSIVKTCSPSI